MSDTPTAVPTTEAADATEAARQGKRRFTLPLLVTFAAALLFAAGWLSGRGNAPEEAPAACLEALDTTDARTGLFVEWLDYRIDASNALLDNDVLLLEDAVDALGDMVEPMEAVTDDYEAAAAACRDLAPEGE